MSKQDELREHNFDGIQEYDNDLPRWWVWLFVVTVLYGVAYPFVYGFPNGDFASQTIDQEVAAHRASRAASQPAALSAASDAELLNIAAKAEVVQKGALVFATRCLVCHGDKGQGLIGPNLTDDYWIHGGNIGAIKNVVLNGVLEKGMLAWKDQLKADEIDSVVSFVWSIRGSNPPNPKEPQGDKVKP